MFRLQEEHLISSEEERQSSSSSLLGVVLLDTWSEHQYHIDGMDMPKMMPGHGRSESTGSLNRWKASSRGMPQVEFGTVTDGMALA